MPLSKAALLGRILVASLALGAAVAHAQPWGELVNLSAGGARGSPYGMSGDGSVVVGDGAFGPPLAAVPGQAFRWTRETGMVSLGSLVPGTSSTARGVSADGRVVVGSSGGEAYRWTESSGMVRLATPYPGNASRALGVNADGSVVVGGADTGLIGNSVAFRWTAMSGMQIVDQVQGALNGTEATAVNGDGSVVVGYRRYWGAGPIATSYSAWRWTPAGGAELMAANVFPTAVSADGRVVAGYTVSPFKGGPPAKASLWTQAGGVVELGTLNGGDSSRAYGINADGSVIVGISRDGAANQAERGFRWTDAGGMVSVVQWLRSNGVRVADALTLVSANAVNADGSVVVGGMSGEDGLVYPYLARVAPGASGLIGMQQFTQSLAAASPPTMALTRASLVLHGAHGNPLLGLAPPGRSCAWMTGDGGRDEVDDRSGRLGVVEVGGCHRFASGPQVKGAVGLARARQDLPTGGRIEQDGGYLLAEAMTTLNRPDLWLTLTGYYGWADFEVNRGYLNAGLPVTSSGNADAPTWAVRGRIDWQDVWRAAGAGVTPYLDLAFMRTRVETYTESGGGFPAHFDARTESATHLRYGLNLVRPLSPRARLLGTLEGVHQFNERSAAVTGQVLGLFTFDLPGAQYKQDWARLGIGADARVGAGTVAAMLNATTEGQDPAWWASISYRVIF